MQRHGDEAMVAAAMRANQLLEDGAATRHWIAFVGQALSVNQFGDEKPHPSPRHEAYCEHQQQSREPRDLAGHPDG